MGSYKGSILFFRLKKKKKKNRLREIKLFAPNQQLSDRESQQFKKELIEKAGKGKRTQTNKIHMLCLTEDTYTLCYRRASDFCRARIRE